MTKLVKFINERSGKMIVPALEVPLSVFESVYSLIEKFLKSEIFFRNKTIKIIFECLENKDYDVTNLCRGMSLKSSKKRPLHANISIN
ncbi:hypothetical protein [Psychroflexus torquis]|uniref:hypothetical protein n=1 Tax=Psychroflexus torquis TaxID=57029 RepID=UPI0000D54AF6